MAGTLAAGAPAALGLTLLAMHFLVFATAASHATGPLIGWIPDSPDMPHPTPSPEPTHCVPYSGGHGCPGG
jgi:hypothetical protein